MGEADLGAVDGTVARRLDERQEVMVSGVEGDLLEGDLERLACGPRRHGWVGRRADGAGRHWPDWRCCGVIP